MKAKEYLSEIRTIDRKIKMLIDEIENLQETITRINVLFTGEEVVDRTRNVHSLEEAIAKKIDTQDLLTCLLSEQTVLKTSRMNVINQVEDNEMAKLLYMRYFKFESWERIAVELGYSIRHIYRLHGKALACVQNILD